MPKQVNIAQDTNDIQITTTQNQITVVEGDNTAVNVTQPTTQVVQVLTGPRGPKGDLPTSGSVNFTGSYNISGSLIVTGSTISTGGFTGSLYGTSSWAINSETASYVNPLTQNVLITGSLTVSGSSTFTNIGPAIFSGSVQGISGFTGSFLGDLTGTASYVEFDNVEGLTQFSSSLSSRTTALEQFSSSLDNTFATDAELNAYTSSANARLDALEVESGSIRSDFNSFTSSYNTDSSSFENRITTNESDISALQSFSSSLDNTFATDAELNTATSSLSSSISALSSSYLSTSASFSSGIELNTSDITALSSSFVSFSGSYNTGSFTGSLQGIASNAITSSYITFSGVDGLTGYSSSISIRVSDLEQFSSSLDVTFATDAELNNYTSSANARLGALEVESGSIRSDFNSFTSSYNTDSASFSSRVSTNEVDISALQSFSSSLDATFATDAQLNAYTASANARLDALEVESGSIRSDFNSFTSSYYTDSSSFALGINTNTTSIVSLTSATSSYVLNSQTGSFILASQTSSMSVASSSAATSASYALTASYIQLSGVDGFTVYSSSVSNRVTNLENFSSSLDATFATDAQLNAYTASANARLGSLEIESGSIRSDFNTFTSSYNTDSSSFSSRVSTNEVDISALQSFSSSLDATFATDAELAAATASLSASISSLSSSYLSTSASFSNGINSNINSISVLSSSFISFSGSYNTGSFTGSFKGDGSGLYNISASGIVGLNLNQITSGSVSASISPNKGLEINTNVVATSFTGSLFGTSSWASNSISSSYALNVDSASYALTSSYVNPLNQDVFITGSLNLTGSTILTGSTTINSLTYPTVDNGEFSFMQTDGLGNLTLQYVNTLYEVVYNGEATQITKGTPVYISGSQGANSIAYRADAGDPTKMPVVYIAADNIDAANTGRAIALGLITGVNTTGYPGGTEIYVGVGGGWTSTRPTGSAIIQVLGYVTKEGSGGQGVVLNAGPANLPNILSGSVWVGNSGSVPVAIPTASLSVASAVTASYAFTASYIDGGFY